MKIKKYILHWVAAFLRYAFGIAIIFYLIRTNQIKFDKIFILDSQTIIIALILSFSQLVLSAYRVKLLLAAHQISISFFRCVIYNVIGIFYSTILPGGMSGDVVRAYYFWLYVHTQNCTKSDLLGALVTDRLFATLAMLFIGLIAATGSAKAINVSFEFLIFLWFVFFVGISGYLFVCNTHKFKLRISKLPYLKFFIDRLQRVLAKLDLKNYTNQTLLLVGLSSIIIHIASVLVIFMIALRLGSGLSFGQVMTVAPVGLLVNALPISPGGMGVGEKGFSILFDLVGGQYGDNVFMIARVFLFSPAIIGAFFACVLVIQKRLRSKNELQIPLFNHKSTEKG